MPYAHPRRTSLLARASLAATLAAGSLVSACAAPQQPLPALQVLQYRAAFDLACPPQDLQLINIDKRTKGVVGCGRRLTYLASCDATLEGGTCSWVLDAPPAAPAPTSVAPASPAFPSGPPAYAPPRSNAPTAPSGNPSGRPDFGI